MSFIETPRFPENIAYGAIGGAMFSTDVVVLGSGFEQRNVNWLEARGKWDVSHGVKLKAEMNVVIAFHRAMKGRAHGFRFKDWSDFQVTVADGLLLQVTDESGKFQITKIYQAGSLIDYRQIKKPVAGTMTFFRNGSPITVGAGAGQISVDTTTGIVTFVPDTTKTIDANIAKTITGLSKANPGSVTAVGHGFTSGDKIKITGVVGMTEVNNLYFTITVVDADHFTIGVNTTSYTTYISGGTATKYGATQTSPVRIYSASHGLTNGKTIGITGVVGMTELNGGLFTVTNSTTDYFDLSAVDGTAYTARTSAGTIQNFPQSTDVLTCACEFDVPVRFDDDRLPVGYVYQGLYQVDQIPIVEIRT